MAHAKQAGTVPAGLLRWAQEVLRPAVNWRALLAAELRRAVAEVEGLLRALGLARQVRVLACDTAAGPAQRVSSARQVQLVGGGGTNMGTGIAAAVALRLRPAVTVVLTDGYTPWPPDAPKGTRVVIGLIGPGAPDAPAWARAVRVQPG
jgi:hypothetical protein